MSSNVFISYSRRETGFVRDVVDDLQAAGHSYWLDYRNLVPGKPWNRQIIDGVSRADIILLVVSKASMGSTYVRDEWSRTLGSGKRIILAVFEAAELPPELKALPWVDFRTDYKRGMRDLLGLIDNPDQEFAPIPESGFKAPRMVWLAFVLSLVTAAVSLFSIWTIIVPLLLVPLPYRILKREYNFTQMRAMLVLLGSATAFTGIIFENNIPETFTEAFTGFSFFVGLALVIVLHLKPMQRWAKPAAMRPASATLSKIKEPQPSKSVKYTIDHALEDADVARELDKAMSQYGHQRVEDDADSELDFVLISAYKGETKYDTDSQVVIPIILQMRDDIARNLSRMQWLDFRRGLRNLKEMAHFLPEPEKLLGALGVLPAGNQAVTPMVVEAISYWLLAVVIVSAGAWLPYWLQFIDEFEWLPVDILLTIGFVFSLGIFVLAAILLTRALSMRQAVLDSTWKLVLGILGIGLLMYIQTFVGPTIGGLGELWASLPDDDARGGSIIMGPILFLFGGLGIAAFMAWRRKDLRNWLPRATEANPSKPLKWMRGEWTAWRAKRATAKS
jgi:hypothetical protein